MLLLQVLYKDIDINISIRYCLHSFQQDIFVVAYNIEFCNWFVDKVFILVELDWGLMISN